MTKTEHRMLLTVHMFTGKMPLYSLLLTLFIPICAYASPQKLEDEKDLFYKGSYPAAKPLLEKAKACCEGIALCAWRLVRGVL